MSGDRVGSSPRAHALWQNLLNRSKIVGAVKIGKAQQKRPFGSALNGGGMKAGNDKPSQRVCVYPFGFDYRNPACR